MIDRFLYWGNHEEAKSGKIKGSCQPPLVFDFMFEALQNYAALRKEKPKQKRKQTPKHATPGLKTSSTPQSPNARKQPTITLPSARTGPVNHRGLSM